MTVLVRRAWLGLSLCLAAPASAAAVGASAPAGTDEAATPSTLKRPPPAEDAGGGPVTFAFGGQARLRYEYDDGFNVKGYAPGTHDQLLLERLRLDLAATFWRQPTVFLQLQDAHAFLTRFGEASFPRSDPLRGPPLDVRQLYVDWPHIGGSAVGLRVGRQQISYGDQRVFGPGSWGNTGRYAWDAAMLRFDTPWLRSDAWVGRYLAYQPDVWPSRPVHDFVTAVSYTQLKQLPFSLDLFYVLKYDSSGTVAGESGEGNLVSHTVGLQAEGRALRVLDGGATLVAQLGTYGRDRLRAFGANGHLGVTLPVAWKPRVAAQLTWGSGDENPHDGVHGTFDGVYGGRDIYFYGYLNLFFWANLWDGEVDLSLHPRRDLAVYVAGHHFELAQARDAWYTTGLVPSRRDETGRSGTTLGNELDVRVVWTPWSHLELVTGYGHFLPGAFVENTGPAAPASWYFGQAGYSW